MPVVIWEDYSIVGILGLDLDLYAHVIFRHTHVPHDFYMGGIKCICAPLGFFPKLPADEKLVREMIQRTVQDIEV